jgi:probable phosphoglycerate mutase
MPIAAKLKLPVLDDRRLMELDAGEFEGRLRSELAEVYPVELACWLSGDDDFAIPGGESRRQLAERGSAALRAVAAAGHRQAAVVTHGGLLSATLRSLLNMPQAVSPFALQNGSITRVSVDEDGRFTLVSFNDVGHLRDAGLSGAGDL